MKYFNYLIIISMLSLFLISCRDDLSQYGYNVEDPPQSCIWQSVDNIYHFNTDLYYDLDCFDFGFDVNEWTLTHTDLQEFIESMYNNNYEIELTWQPIGTTCEASTANAPRLVIDGNCIYLGNELYHNTLTWYETNSIDDQHKEYDMILKIENVYDNMSSQTGTLLWKTTIPGAIIQPSYNLTWKGYFIPTVGSRRIYEYYYFTYF